MFVIKIVLSPLGSRTVFSWEYSRKKISLYDVAMNDGPSARCYHGRMHLTVAVYFDDPSFDGYPFTKDEYRASYHDFARLLASKGATFAIVRGKETYMGRNTFSRAWVFDGASFVERKGPFRPDVIYDKGTAAFDADARMSHDPGLDKICTRKDETYALFPDVSPLTMRIDAADDIEPALTRMRTDLVVIKPVDGQEGDGVHVLAHDAVASAIPSFPYLIQEFIDTSGGIPGVTEGRHDLRIVSILGEPILAFVRTPPTGSYLANVSQGGSTIEVPVARLPAGALELFRKVDAAMRRFPHRLYSTDMGLDRSGRWFLIELNAKPALFGRHRGPAFALFHERLADLLLSCIDR